MSEEEQINLRTLTKEVHDFRQEVREDIRQINRALIGEVGGSKPSLVEQVRSNTGAIIRTQEATLKNAQGIEKISAQMVYALWGLLMTALGTLGAIITSIFKSV